MSLCLGRYHENFTGVVMSSTEERFWDKVAICPYGGCWEWIGARGKHGYGNFWDGQRYARAHRFSLALHGQPILPGQHVLHSCDNPGCVNPDHLRTGTHSQNMQDAFQRGRGRTPESSGENNGRAKLTRSDVAEIRSSRATRLELADTYGVSISLIGKIQRREVWK